MKCWKGKFFVLLTVHLTLMQWINAQAEGFNSSQNVKEAIDQTIIPYMKKRNIPGLAIGLYYGNTASLFSYGYANQELQTLVTPNTIFEIASLTKVFTTTELALQVKEDHLSLNDPVGLFIPQIDKYRGVINQVSLLELATHTASLPRAPPVNMIGHKDSGLLILNYLQNWEPEYPLNTRYRYSNLGFALLGYALENYNQMPYQEMIAKDILIPLNMHSTFVEVPNYLLQNYAQGYSPDGLPTQKLPYNPWPGSGAMRSTAKDMLFFLEANLQINGPKKLIEAMQYAQQGFFKVNDKLTIGLAWQRVQVEDLFIIDKNGGVEGFASYIGMIPQKKIGIVILANKAKLNSTQLGRLLLKRLNNLS